MTILTKNSDNYYHILGIPVNANTTEVKKAYRQLMLKYHPDVTQNPLEIENFEKVVRAYKILSNPKERLEYNKSKGISSSYTNDIINVQKVKPVSQKTEDKDNRSSFIDKINFKSFIGRIKNKNNGQSEEDFFEVPKEILKLSPDDLRERFMQSSNKYVRSEALKGMVLLWGTKAFKLIERGFHDQSKEVKEVSIRAIGRLKIRQGVSHLAQIYEKSGPHLRKAIVQSMAGLQIPKANEWLVQFCYDTNEEVQLEALAAIKKHKLYSYVPQIKNLAYHRNQQIQLMVKTLVKVNGTNE